MTTTEAAIQAGIQTGLQALAAFNGASIVINDWGVLDQSSALAPYVIISTADEFEARKDTAATQTRWTIPLELCERFTDWPTTLGNIRDRRQAIIDQFNSVTIPPAMRAAGGIEGLTIDRVFSGGPIAAYYDRYLTAAQMAEALPIFLRQTILLECQEY